MISQYQFHQVHSPALKAPHFFLFKEVKHELFPPPSEIDIEKLTLEFQRRYPKEKYRSAPWWQGRGSEGPMEIQKYRIRLVEILNDWDEREFVPLRLFVPGVPEALMQASDQLRVEDRVYIEQLLIYIKDPRGREAVEFYYGLKGEKPLTQEEIGRRFEPQLTIGQYV